jgi:hypothetical protein
MFLTAKQRAKGSLNPEFAAMCGGEFRHTNFLMAMQAADNLEKFDHSEGREKPVVIYHCDFCGAEHLGHLDKTPKFRFPSQDDEIIAIVKSGKAVTRQGKPSILCPSMSS